ncbi:MAG: WD40/YVTN/BNR-like repeat-containing protein [Phycisphaerae bacterium]
MFSLRSVLYSIAWVSVVGFALPGCAPMPDGGTDGDNTNMDGNDNGDQGTDNSDGNDNDGDPDGAGTITWSEPYDATDDGFLSAAWGTGPDNVYIVGGQPDSGVILHFDGTDYARETIPDVPILIWAFGFGEDEIYAVGEQGAVLLFDGTAWTELDSGTDIDLFGVWGSSPDDIWMVGGEAGFGSPVILRYDGTTFENVPVPETDREDSALLKVWGTAADDVFAVGEQGLILRYDGTSWTQQPSGTSEDLVALWGTGSDNIVAVGGRANAAVLTYDGTSWSVRSTPGLAGLNGVFLVEPDVAVIGGLVGTLADFNIVSGDVTLASSTTIDTIHAIFEDGAGTFYAVGGQNFGSPFTGVLLVRDNE